MRRLPYTMLAADLHLSLREGEYLERHAAELATLDALSAKARKPADARQAAARKQAARKHA